MVMATVTTGLAYNDCTFSWWCLAAFISGCAASAYMTSIVQTPDWATWGRGPPGVVQFRKTFNSLCFAVVAFARRGPVVRHCTYCWITEALFTQSYISISGFLSALALITHVNDVICLNVMLLFSNKEKILIGALTYLKIFNTIMETLAYFTPNLCNLCD